MKPVEPGRMRVRRVLLCLACAASILFPPRLSLAEEALQDVVARVKPSVLAVGFYKETSNPRFGFRGTGFVVGDGNMLVTNAHVIDRPGEAPDLDGLAVYVRDSGGENAIRRAEVIELDTPHDLALLRFQGSRLPALALSPPKTVREGQSVAFMGFPMGGVLGFAPVTHRGIVSSITAVALPSPTARQLDGSTISRIKAGPFELLQLDATAYPGNSGGPLFDVNTGAIIGVVNMVTLKGTRESALTHPSGISYAIPVDFVLRLLASAPK